MSKIAIGTAQFGQAYGIANTRGEVPKEEVKLILNYARTKGIDTLDTAAMYGNSENVLGELGVADFKTISKLEEVPENCSDTEKWILNSVSNSMLKLNVNSLYGMLLHRPQQLLSLNGFKIYNSLVKLKEKSIVKKIGISIYDIEELETLNKFNYDLIQIPFNIIDQRLVSSGWLERLYKKGVEVHVRSIFLQGLLIMDKHKRQTKFNKWDKEVWNKYDKWLIENQITPLNACINFALSFPTISKVVIGVDSLSHFKEILSNSDSALKSLTPINFYSKDSMLINPSRWKEI